MGYCKGLEDRLKEVESHIGEVVAGREIINGWVNTVTYEDGTYRSRGMYVLKCKSCGRLKYLVSSELAAFKKPCRCAKRHFVPQTTDEELAKSYVGKMIAGTREIVDISKDGRGLYSGLRMPCLWEDFKRHSPRRYSIEYGGTPMPARVHVARN